MIPENSSKNVKNINLEKKLDQNFLEKIIKEEPWKIALRLNLLDSDEGSRFTINNNFDKYSSELKDKLGEDKFKELSGVVAYANSMLLDFESALPYALIEDNKESLIRLQESAILYGRSEVVSSLDTLGRENNITDFIIDKNDMQNFLIYHSLPQIRLCRSKDISYKYELDPELLKGLLDKINIDKKKAIYLALELLEEKHNQNIPRKFIFSQILENKTLIDRYKKELKEKYSIPRENIDALVKERAIFLNQGEISRLQFGDENPIFPTASNIFLVNNNGNKKVWKEDLRLYTDFSRLDGYSSEKEILSALNHDNIIKLLGTFNEKNINFLELEYAKGKTLEAYSDISEEEALGITITLCNVLDYLHSQNIVYMDMKKKNVMYNRPEKIEKNRKNSIAENNVINEKDNTHEKSKKNDIKVKSEKGIMLDSEYGLEAITKNIKLLDFGMSQKKEQLDDSTILTTLLSTPEYLSPELTSFRSSIATDTFQLGLLLHNLIYKNHAFIDSSLKLKVGDNYRESEVLMYGLAVKYEKYISSKDLYGPLLSKMLEKDPSKRPNLTYVKNELINIYNSKFYTPPSLNKSDDTATLVKSGGLNKPDDLVKLVKSDMLTTSNKSAIPFVTSAFIRSNVYNPITREDNGGDIYDWIQYD